MLGKKSPFLNKMSPFKCSFQNSYFSTVAPVPIVSQEIPLESFNFLSLCRFIIINPRLRHIKESDGECFQCKGTEQLSQSRYFSVGNTR